MRGEMQEGGRFVSLKLISCCSGFQLVEGEACAVIFFVGAPLLQERRPGVRARLFYRCRNSCILQYILMKNNFNLDFQHPNANRVEHFLSQIDQPLQQIPFDGKDWKRSENIVAGFKFNAEKSSLMIIVIFASSYSDANEITGANAIAYKNFTVNGDVLFVVVSADEAVQGEILGLFAGKE